MTLEYLDVSKLPREAPFTDIAGKSCDLAEFVRSCEVDLREQRKLRKQANPKTEDTI